MFDRVAFHVYSTRFIECLSALTQKPVWITESGAEGTAQHLDWFTSTFEEIRSGFPLVERIYWFDLFDFQPNRFRLFDIVRDPGEGFRAVEESVELIAFLKNRVNEASGGTRASYEELIPDIMLYFPTEEDLRIIEQYRSYIPKTQSGLLGTNPRPCSIDNRCGPDDNAVRADDRSGQGARCVPGGLRP